MSELQNRIREDIKLAMKAGEKQRLGTLRLITAAIKQREVDERIELDDADVLALLDKMVKQRRESIEQFTAAGRDDLAATEQAELDLLQTYLPQQMSEAEINTLIDDALAQSGAQSMKDMGKVMGIIKPAAQGRADMAAVSKLIKARLA